MKINLVSVDDSLMSHGARRMSAYMASLNHDTTFYLTPLRHFRSLVNTLLMGGMSGLDPATEARPIADAIARADIVAFSSMTHSAEATKTIIGEVRRVNPRAFIVWGGVHPIIAPEDAIEHADAICTGEGESAFAEFFEAFRNERDYTGTRNFWFKRNGTVIRNGFRALMSSGDMDTLPLPTYGRDEFIYHAKDRRYVPTTPHDYLRATGLTYNTIWTIGCPFKCTYCGNSKFIDNDRGYARLRHPSPRWLVNELEAALRVHPHISNVIFNDDSFMALPDTVLSEFAVLYKREIGLPFCVMGVIPSYVKASKMEILLEAGLNRVRMGIQSGSRRILNFYKRPSKPEKIIRAADVIAGYTKFMIPPAYDIIVDNPVETRQDVVDTLELVYRLPRPFTLNLFSLRVQPNTELAQQLESLNITAPEMAKSCYWTLFPSFANCLLTLLACVRPPRWLFDRLLKRVQPLCSKQPVYPRLHVLSRLAYLSKRAFSHLRFMDFSVLPGRTAAILWRLGIVGFWNRHVVRKYKRIPSAACKGDAKTGPSSATSLSAPSAAT